MKTRQEAFNTYHSPHYLLTCPHCKAELVVHSNDIERKLFEPRKVEEETTKIVIETDENGNSTGKRRFVKEIREAVKSSDPSKDVYPVKCCNCGHTWDEPSKGLHEKYCNPDGNDNIVFELGKVETQRARDFIKKHNHRDDFKREGKLAFSTLGMQFTYTITPGGLGPLVSIKCNKCGESQDITDTEDW